MPPLNFDVLPFMEGVASTGWPAPLLLAGGMLALGSLLAFVAMLGSSLRMGMSLSKIREAPNGMLFLGHVWTLLFSGVPAWEVMTGWLESTGCDILRWRVFQTHWVIVRGPQAARRIFQTRFKTYAKELGFSYQPFLPILGSGLVTSHGELWQEQRTLMGPALRVHILEDIVQIAKTAVDRLTAKLMAEGPGAVVEMEEEFRLLTLQVIAEAILSLDPKESDKVFPELYLPVMQEANRRVLERWRCFLPTPSWFAYNRKVAALNAYITTVLRRRWQELQSGEVEGGRDILHRILVALKEEGRPWTTQVEQQLCCEIKTFILAGHETSASMLTYSFFELSRSPEVLARVRSEAAVVFGEEEGHTTREKVESMHYSLGVLKEALRRYSVVPVVTRVLEQPDELLGHNLPAGTRVVVHVKATHDMWEEPMTFRPERFLPGEEYDRFPEKERAFMFLPFIQGPRNCLGQHLALVESRIVMSLLVKRFDFVPAFAVPPPGQALPHHGDIPVGPLGGLPMKVFRRGPEAKIAASAGHHLDVAADCRVD